MKRSLLIVGAGTYAVVAYEIASDMAFFERISFVDDVKNQDPLGKKIVGTTGELRKLSECYTDVFVAIGAPEVRMELIGKIQRETNLNLAILISPKAYVATSAKLSEGVIVEPMAVVHSLCEIQRGCIISAGAVVNHASVCEEGVHVDCNATVPGYQTVPAQTKVACGTVFKL